MKDWSNQMDWDGPKQNNIRFYGKEIPEYTRITDKQVKQSFRIWVFLLLFHIVFKGVHKKMTPSVCISEQ